MDGLKNGWFSEISDLWPGQCFSLQIEEILHNERSKYQDVLVVKTKSHGRALILDGIIQCTEHDEFAYQEMITFLPLCAHPNPSHVLIVGGGDGGVAREAIKHPLVKTVTQVEIDSVVIEASKKYLPFMSKSFTSPKLTLHVCDGFEFMRNHTGEFDVIITDSSDPVGPAEALFTESYFGLLKNALKSGGIICSQAGTIWANLDQIKETFKHCRKHFANVRYAITNVPTYPTGQIGFILGTADNNRNLSEPRHEINGDLKYYNNEIHRSSFVLPNFAKNAF